VLEALAKTFEILGKKLMFIPFVMITGGFILSLLKAGHSSQPAMPIIVRTAFVVFLVINSGPVLHWADNTMIAIGEEVSGEDYTNNPIKAIGKVTEKLEDGNRKAWYQQLLGGGLDQYLAQTLLVLFGWLVEGVVIAMTVGQRILLQFSYFFAPFILSLLIFPNLASTATRFLFSTIGIMLWPLGFGLSKLASQNVLVSYMDSKGGILETSVDHTLGPLLSAIMLLIGVLMTPKIMGSFCSSGSGLAGAVGAAMKLVTTVATLGAGAIGLKASAMSGGGGLGKIKKMFSRGGGAGTGGSVIPVSSSGGGASIGVGTGQPGPFFMKGAGTSPPKHIGMGPGKPGSFFMEGAGESYKGPEEDKK